jgi:hypothetical protein
VVGGVDGDGNFAEVFGSGYDKARAGDLDAAAGPDPRDAVLNATALLKQ